MEKAYPILKVRMLGGFQVTYGNEVLSFQRNNFTKAMRLLQILLYHDQSGITREKLIEDLYGREEVADAANSLRVTVYRAKKMLLSAGLPEYPYIKVKKGIYRWDCPMPIEIDVLEFDRILEEGQKAENESEQMELFYQACKAYTGEFLPGLSDEDWAIIESVNYKRKYFYALEQVCGYLKRENRYEEVLELCKPACEMYPFDEWQAERMEAFVALNRYQEAIEEYENTARMLFEELGVRPSEKIMAQFQEMSSKLSLQQQDITDIKNDLKEGDEHPQGAFYCSLPSFRDSYRLVRRIIERNGQSGYLMLVSIVLGNKGKIGDLSEKAVKKQETMAGELYNVIKKCLRKGDSFTKYSSSQYLILLVGINQENCDIVSDRIRKCFSTEHKSWADYLEFYVSTIADVENQKSRIRFEGMEDVWDEEPKQEDEEK